MSVNTRRRRKPMSMSEALGVITSAGQQEVVWLAYVFRSIGGANRVRRIVALARLVKAGCLVKRVYNAEPYNRVNVGGAILSPDEMVRLASRIFRRAG